MDIASLSMAMANNQLATQVSMATMKLVKDQMSISGSQMVEQIKQMNVSLDPNLGQNIDISI